MSIPLSYESLSSALNATRTLLHSYVNSDSALTSWVVTCVCVGVTLLCVVLFVAVGWSIVWICFLSRFKFVRELLLGNANNNNSSSSSSTNQTPEKSATPTTTSQQQASKRRKKSKLAHYD